MMKLKDILTILALLAIAACKEPGACEGSEFVGTNNTSGGDELTVTSSCKFTSSDADGCVFKGSFEDNNKGEISGSGRFVFKSGTDECGVESDEYPFIQTFEYEFNQDEVVIQRDM